jgi:mannan endo-1,6-alpha-mannosidase
MSALAVIGSNLIDPSMAPLTLASGAQSESNPNSGIQNVPTASTPEPVTAGDKAGAAILTILLAVFAVGGAYWLVCD